MMRVWILRETRLGMPARVAGTIVALAIAGGAAFADNGANTQTAELYQLQAEFHRAASVHDPVNGDSQAVVDQQNPGDAVDLDGRRPAATPGR